MGETVKYENYEKIMNTIYALNNVNIDDKNSEFKAVITLITLFPIIVRRHVEKFIFSTLTEVLNISIDDYVPMVINCAITSWLAITREKGQKHVFLTLLNSEKHESYLYQNYVLVYNFYRVIYGCMVNYLPVCINPYETDQDLYTDDNILENLSANIVDKDSILIKGFSDYRYAIESYYNKTLVSQLVCSININNFIILSKVTKLFKNMKEYFIDYYKDLGVPEDCIKKIAYASATKVYDRIIINAVSYMEKTTIDDILLLIYKSNNDDVDENNVIKALIKAIKDNKMTIHEYTCPCDHIINMIDFL